MLRVACLALVFNVLPQARAVPGEDGWLQAGPERGHVLDASASADEVAVATRAGVLLAAQGGPWVRDPRFPPGVRRLALGRDGVAWAAPQNQLWEVGGAETRLLLDFGSRSTVVGLTPVPGGSLALVRGEEAGVIKLGSGPRRVWSGAPWVAAALEERVLLGTLDSGAWLSRDGGESWEQILEEGSVSAVGWSEDMAWVATSSGVILASPPGDLDCRMLTEVHRLRSGHVLALVPAGQGTLGVVSRHGSGHDTLLWGRGGRLRELPPRPVDQDPGPITLTGAWPAPGGEVLVGTFRRGPATWGPGGRLSPSRRGFQATITGDATVLRDGRLLLALMGTGVYTSADPTEGWEAQHGAGGPVTDAVAVAPMADGAVVLDFDGLARLDEDGRWLRIDPPPSVGGHHSLVDLGVDGVGGIWVVDRQGGLWTQDGTSWRRCATNGALRLDGHGDGLRLVTGSGVHRPGGCSSPWPEVPVPAPASFDPHTHRASGDWLAADGVLWRVGEQVAVFPAGSISAMAEVEHGVLLGMEAGQVISCRGQCRQVGHTLDTRPEAIGELPCGRVWVAEAAGTLLLQGGSAVPPWSVHRDQPPRRRDLMDLERPPWSREGQGGGAQAAPPGHPAPPPGPPGAGAPSPAGGGTSEAWSGCSCASSRGGLTPAGALSAMLIGILLPAAISGRRSRRP